MKIKKITREKFTGTVYNFHCKPDEMYFSQGMLVHNCYKSNNPNGHNMSLEQFKNIIDKMPFLTQCALGADAQGITNPDMFPMMEYARSKGIMPNLTIASTNDGKMYIDDRYHDRDQTAKIVIRRKKIES